jgi:hypothetical protein
MRAYHKGSLIMGIAHLAKRLEFESEENGEGASDGGCELSNEQLDMVVAQIRRITRCANLEFALRVGAIIIHHFYDGDTSRWRSRGAKVSSFRRLAQHPELPFSAGALYRCVALFELCERFKAPSRWEHLGASHLRIVLGLPPDVQERILVVANENRWTVKTLQLAIARERVKRTTRGGRRPRPAMTNSLKTVKKVLEDHANVLQHLQVSPREELQASVELIEETRAHVESLLQSLQVALNRMATA